MARKSTVTGNLTIRLGKPEDKAIRERLTEMAQLFPDGKTGVVRKAVEHLYRQGEIQAALNALHQARIKK